MVTACLKYDKLESTLCNDCGHTANNNGAFINWSLLLEDSSNIKKYVGYCISL